MWRRNEKSEISILLKKDEAEYYFEIRSQIKEIKLRLNKITSNLEKRLKDLKKLEG